MENLSQILILLVAAIAAVYILKTVLKIALRVAVLVVIAVLAFLYFTGNLPFLP
ncbi:MAG: hypothetical protein GX197_04660 [Firmicutes bacterium]|nr:hypothetical protein [Bacillota bacterium]